MKDFIFKALTIAAFALSLLGFVGGSSAVSSPSFGAIGVATSKSIYKAPGFQAYLLPNQATSTLSGIGCFQAYATSSATSIKLLFTPTTATTTLGGGTSVGLVAWAYGTCP